MKILRKYRRTKRALRRSGIAALFASLAFLVGACQWDTPNGEIQEVELGENGHKIEYHDAAVPSDDVGEASREVYLKPGSGCAEGELIQDCAEPEDVLVPVDQVATEQGVEPGMFRDCEHAAAINATPLTVRHPGWNPALDKDRDGIACE